MFVIPLSTLSYTIIFPPPSAVIRGQSYNKLLEQIPPVSFTTTLDQT